MIVVDASLVAKLILDEHDSDLAEQWYLGLREPAVAPELIVIEVAQAIVRRVNTRQNTIAQGRIGLQAWREILDGGGITLVQNSVAQIHAAAEIALTLGHPVKDCVYLALAMARDAALVTCDAKFADRARSVYPAIALLADA